MRMMSALPPEKEEYLSKPKGVEYPLAASCLGCQKDESAQGKLSRCAGCKLVRYAASILSWFGVWRVLYFLLLGIVVPDARLMIGRGTRR
jgi:hypothetical protein